MTTNAEIRKILFPIYSKNLSFYRPELADKFLCPVCLNEFSDPSKLALAHVIPESIGGKLKTLVCMDCDSKVGHKYDRHLAKEKKHFDKLKNKEKKTTVEYAFFQPKKAKGINVMIDYEGMNAPNPHMKFYNPPGMPLNVWRNYFSQKGIGDSLEFSLHFTSKAIDLRKRNLSLIYASFLMMFYQFGYEYILSENADYIRQAIISKSPSNDFRNAIDYVKWGPMMEPFSLPTLAVTRISKDLCFMSTLIPFDDESGYMVQLPSGPKGKTAYDNLLQMTQGTFKTDTKVMPNNIAHELLDDPKTKGLGEMVYKKLTELPLDVD